MACELASENIDKGGGTFGTVIVKDGEIVATGCNSVTLTNATTAHAEVNVIRRACASVANFNSMVVSSIFCVSLAPCVKRSLLGWCDPHLLRAIHRPMPVTSTSTIIFL